MPVGREENLSEALDAVDAKILDLIQHDAGLSVAEIAAMPFDEYVHWLAYFRMKADAA